jgi:glycosyltransferase involved in cell wall biosynthesis
LVQEKGFAEFFAAMRRVLGERAKARALIIGPVDPGQSDGLRPEDLVGELEPSRAIWLGHREDIADLYGAMDVFALPSYREGVPRSLMEASASGLAVVASNIRGCREVVRDGVTGILVEPREVDPLYRAILRLVDEPETRREMGRVGRAHIVENFNAAQVLDRLADYYRELTGTL